MEKSIVIFTEEEKEEIINELYQRVLDLVHIHGKDKVIEMFDQTIKKQHLFDNHNTSQGISFEYSFNMCWGDILQIAARVRRKKWS